MGIGFIIFILVGFMMRADDAWLLIKIVFWLGISMLGILAMLSK